MKHGWKSIKQKLLPRTLYGRSLMIIVLPVLILQMIVAHVFIGRHWDSMSSKLVFALAGEVGMITDQIKHARTPDEVMEISRQAAGALDLKISIENKPVAIKKRQSPSPLIWPGVEDKLQKLLQQRLTDPFRIVAHEDKRIEVFVQVDNENSIRFLTYARRLTSPATYAFLAWMIGSSIVLMAVAVLFMRNQLRPIHRLAIAAEKLGKGQDVADFKLEGAREIRQAARTFLEMRDRIRRQIEQRTAMLAGVSHDLRTPLTRMKLQLAMMKNTPDADSLRQDLEEMEKMLEGYLTFARGEGTEPTERVELKSMLERICNNARRQGFSVEEKIDDVLALRARPVAIERALSNVVTNACKYAKHVWVSADADDETLEIFVDDDGPGIPEAQREEVFKPFYRLEKSRNPKTGGVGLGLSIAQDIVHGHGGEILLEKSKKGGLRVVIRLPL